MQETLLTANNEKIRKLPMRHDERQMRGIARYVEHDGPQKRLAGRKFAGERQPPFASGIKSLLTCSRRVNPLIGGVQQVDLYIKRALIDRFCLTGNAHRDQIKSTLCLHAIGTDADGGLLDNALNSETPVVEAAILLHEENSLGTQ